MTASPLLSERKRRIPRIGISISELGFGAWGIGGRFVGTQTPIDGRAALRSYLEAGGNFIDTALTYGESERTIGPVLKEFGSRESVYIATKTKSGETADTVPQIRKDLEASLKNLQRDHVDILYLHLPPEDDSVIDAALGECEALKKEGKILGIGASIKGPAVTDKTVSLCKKYTDTRRVDVIQLVYSILRQKNRAAVDYAAARDVGIVVRTCMESGFLTGKFLPGTRFPENDHRCRWNGSADAIIKEVEKIKKTALKPPYTTVGELAIQFALLPPGVTGVIVGAKNETQQKSNIAAFLLEPPEAEIVRFLTEEFKDATETCNPSE
jgi:aryl-alcohol dehydrogenase-like predicted oxidoreductase